MNQEMKNRLLGLNTEALVEILESVCRYAEVELHFGQDPADCINSPVFYAYEPHYGSWTVLNYDPVLHDKPKEMPKEMPKFAEFGSVRFVCNNNLKQKQDNGCGCYQDPPCLGCVEEQKEQVMPFELFSTDHEKDIEELKLRLDILRQERDEAIIHANNVVRESSSLITAKIPSGSCGGYWNAVDNFRRFESTTT